MHRRRGVDRDLLFENDMQQRRETITAAAKPRHAGAIENGAKNRFAGQRVNSLFQMLRRVNRLHSISRLV